ncbi:family helicase/ATPase-like protein [Stipitochalara longipes BDJ]|nr:family helicase/ATPase-like protein [Stipitochalara longipes BDJ]
MASNANDTQASCLVADSPAVKRQKTVSGYNSTSNSATNTKAYNSENDDGDDLLNDYVPDTPGSTFETQPTQIINRSAPPPSSPPTPATPSQIQVPASSPFTGPTPGRVSDKVHFSNNAGPKSIPSPFTGSGSKYVKIGQNAGPRPMQNGVAPAKRPLALAMAPAGTAYRPPHGIVKQPVVIDLDDSEDDGPKFQGGSSSDDEAQNRANIKPTSFIKSPQSSFNGSASGQSPTGNARFQNIVSNAAYKGPEKGKVFTKPRTSPVPSGNGSRGKKLTQMRPERAKPIEDISLDDIPEAAIRDSIVNIRKILPMTTILTAKNALINSHYNWEDAVSLLCSKEPPVVISDDEIESPQPAMKPEPQMKRTLDGPVQNIRDKYSSTQALAPKKSAVATPPPKPRKRLVKGRRNPSSPAIPAISSPLKLQSPPAPSPPAQSPPAAAYDSYDSDSGIASESEEDPELDGRVLKFLNTCKVDDLVELTNTTKVIAEVMIAARPFRNLDIARAVENTKLLKSGKKSARAPVGDRIVEAVEKMLKGYEGIDTLVKRCGELGKPLAEEMGKWGFDVFGAQKDGELEMTSLEDDIESQRDSGIGSPSSRAASHNGDDEIKLTSTRKRNVQFLKKPDLMAESAVLKDYQVVGLNWLALMYRHGLSGILADEMGLGKTCQVIAFLTHLVEIGHSGPHLVVCPGSTLENWLREFQKFSPDLVVEPYHGPQGQRGEMAEQILASSDQINVVVTTYDMAAKKEDNKFMKRLKPDVCVYDEGHMLKNVNSQRYQGLIKIPALFRLLLTGTPLQNNLQELAALLAFILPDVFKEVEGDLNVIFKAKATTQDADHAALLSAQRIQRARSMLTPFVLRRKKAQVLKHLPPKVCRVQYCTLHPSQQEIYDGHLDQARERARIRLEGGKIPKSDENNPLMQLRKAAIHPLLFRRHFTDEKIEKMADILRKKDPVNFPATSKRHHLIEEMRNASDFWLHGWCLDYPCIRSFDIADLAWMDSGKVEAMVKLVKTYKANGDRVLIFSQFALVLDILESVLNSSLIHFTRIDGSTKIDERQSLIDTFRDDESITAFLLTTKAGGTGINLMYANKVIIFDGSFNPQDDRQAENRAHRVGQTRDVEVVRLVTKGTVEEQIFALGQSKLLLDGRVAGDSEDGGKAEEAGEKAVAKMLLEGTGMSSSDAKDEDTKDDVKAEESKDGVKEEKHKIEVKLEVMSPERKLPQRKKSSILDMLTRGGSRSEVKEEELKVKKELVVLDEDGD